MGRHNEQAWGVPDEQDGPNGQDRPDVAAPVVAAGERRRVLVPALVVLALAATGLTGAVLANPGMVVDRLPGNPAQPAAGAGCSKSEVVLAVTPEAVTAVTQVLAPALGTRLPDDTCLDAVVRSQEPLETVQTTTVLPADRLPDLWIPDSSLWLAQVKGVPTTAAGSFATSPVVIATSKAAVTALNWGSHAPTWAGALTGQRAVAVPDLAKSATGLLSVLALRTSAGGGSRADQAVAATVLASQRADAPTAEAAFKDAGTGAADAPLVPASEQAIFVANRAVKQPSLVAVYPADGSPSLDYPVVRMAPATRSAGQRGAIDAVVKTLLTSAARDAARREGFRQPGQSGPTGSGVQPGAVSALTLPPADQIDALLSKLATLSEPIRMLTVIDISPSMSRQATPTSTRIQLVRDAAKGALQLLPDGNQVGAWVFSANLAPGVNHVPIAPVRKLDAVDGKVSHRATIIGALDRLPSSLAGNGTALYSTTLDAVQALESSFDTTATNVVVLLTDGTNEAVPGLDQAGLVAQLKKIDTTGKPVRLIAVGIGPTADMAALRAMVAATPNGKAYQATDPTALQSVLFDALSSRR